MDSIREEEAHRYEIAKEIEREAGMVGKQTIVHFEEPHEPLIGAKIEWLLFPLCILRKTSIAMLRKTPTDKGSQCAIVAVLVNGQSIDTGFCVDSEEEWLDLGLRLVEAHEVKPH